MAIATSTALLIGAGIAAGGTAGGAAISSRASGKATEAGLEANQAAIDLAKEQEATRRAEFDEAQAAYKQQWDAWQANRQVLLQRYGIDIAPPQAPPTAGLPAGGPPAGMPQGAVPRGGAAPAGAPRQGLTLAEMAQRRPGLGEWNDWGAMGLREGARRA